MLPRGEVQPGHGEVHVDVTGVKSICWWGAATALNHNKISLGRDVPERCQAETSPVQWWKAGREPRTETAEPGLARPEALVEEDGPWALLQL